MLCENCRENDAVVNLTTIKDNAVTQQHLCEKCAAAKGVETSVSPAKHPLGGQTALKTSGPEGHASRCGIDGPKQ